MIDCLSSSRRRCNSAHKVRGACVHYDEIGELRPGCGRGTLFRSRSAARLRRHRSTSGPRLLNGPGGGGGGWSTVGYLGHRRAYPLRNQVWVWRHRTSGCCAGSSDPLGVVDSREKPFSCSAHSPSVSPGCMTRFTEQFRRVGCRSSSSSGNGAYFPFGLIRHSERPACGSREVYITVIHGQPCIG